MKPAATRMLVVGLRRGAAWARALAAEPGFEIAGLVDPNPEALAAVASELGIGRDRCFAEFAQAGPDRADIAVLAVPTPLHRGLTRAALEAGCHVICEKPLALSLEEAHAMARDVASSGLHFMVGEQYRFADGVENLRRAVEAGVIGDLAYITHEYYRGAFLTASYWGTATHWSSAYRHVQLHDQSPHHFDMWWFITGRKTRDIYVRPFDVPWNQTGLGFGYTAVASLEGGVQVNYLYARALAREPTSWFGRMTIVGETGTLTWDGEAAEIGLDRVSAGPTGEAIREHEMLAYVDRGLIGTNAPVVAMVRAFVEAIRENRRNPNDIEDNMVSFATTMAALDSIDSGHPMPVFGSQQATGLDPDAPRAGVAGIAPPEPA